MNKKIVKRFFIFISVLIVLILVSIEPIDKATLETQTFVSTMLDAVDSAMTQLDTSKNAIRAGWSKRNITPEEPVRIVGFGYQGDFEHVHDSTFVRTVVFSNGKKTIALISYDLLFVHPNLVEHLEKELDDQPFHLDGIYFTATHTHNSFGGWGYNRAFDEVMLDGEENHILNHVTKQTVESLSESINLMETTLIGASSFDFGDYIRNRVSSKGTLDPWMHVVKLVHPSSKDTAIISTFSAHATCLYSQMDLNTLSSDYPGVLSSGIETNSNNLLIFCAGGVGSFSPTHERSNFKNMKLYGNGLLADLKDSLAIIELEQTHQFDFFEIDLIMPEPCLKVSSSYKIKPWLFHLTIGQAPSQLKYLRVGSSSFLGFPGEISGELYLEEINKAKEENKELIVTSFNGNYTGYIMPDHYYYTEDDHEVKGMNWYGPNCGSYFSKIVHQINTSN